MAVTVITGSAGLIGSETVKFFHKQGLDIIGIDNNMRKYFFGPDGSVEWNKEQLKSKLKNYTHHDIDIRDHEKIFKLFKDHGKNIHSVIHAAAQPSHDWAAKEPITDFTVNANGTVNLLEATRLYSPEAPFIFTSTNKVYGDTPNYLPLVETSSRYELDQNHKYYEFGIDETMGIDQTRHSVFGASKVAADVMVQEYGRYFDMNTSVFRGGCLTGPAHSAAELHGFLGYLIKCAMTQKLYTIFGYDGKQVRDNIHSYDLVSAFWEYVQSPKGGGVTYNIGGSRHSNCSILEAIDMVAEISGNRLNYHISKDNRIGDHIWWISDVRRFQNDYPNWKYTYGMKDILEEMISVIGKRAKRQ